MVIFDDLVETNHAIPRIQRRRCRVRRFGAPGCCRAPTGRMDVTRFGRCAAAPNCSAVIDPAPRGWIVALVSAEETAAQTAFCDAFEVEDLVGAVEGRPGAGELPGSDEISVLSGVSDNGARAGELPGSDEISVLSGVSDNGARAGELPGSDEISVLSGVSDNGARWRIARQ